MAEEEVCPSCSEEEEEEQQQAGRLNAQYSQPLALIQRHLDSLLERHGLPDHLYGNVEFEPDKEGVLSLSVMVLDTDRHDRIVYEADYPLPPPNELPGWLNEVQRGRQGTEPIHWVDDVEAFFRIGEYAPQEEVAPPGSYYCPYCNVTSEQPHEHGGDTPPPLLPPWRLER